MAHELRRLDEAVAMTRISLDPQARTVAFASMQIDQSALQLWSGDAAVSVVLASGGYPDSYETGKVIAGLGNAANVPGVILFHAGTARRGNDIVTAGGRVLTVVAEGRDYRQAISRAYEAAGRITFDRMFMREDIGRKAVGV